MTRFRIVCALGLLLVASVSSAWAAAKSSAVAGKVRIYVGTYTDGKSEGIYTCQLDLMTGKPSQAVLAAKVKNPSFLALHPSNKYLYAVSEIEDLNGQMTGGVVAFARDATTGDLTYLNGQSSEGAGPCHLVVDKTGNVVLVANYGGGSVSALPIAADGSLEKAASAIQHQGKSVDPNRQQAPHAHSINVDPGNHFACAADLGLDQVLIYRLDPKLGQLTPNDPPHVAVTPGSGPRHFAFHPSGNYAYVINEMANTVTAFSFDAKQGALTVMQTISTLPEGFSGTSYTAEVQVHPSGKFLYGSNRGHDSIAIFSIDGTTGQLTSLGQESTGGKTPRNFGIDPTGSYLLAANQDSDSIVILGIDPTTGALKPTGNVLDVPKPVCVKFVREP